MKATLTIEVNRETSTGGSYPVEWCDLSKAWRDGRATLSEYLHAPVTRAPEGYDKTCVNRIYPALAPASEWEQEPENDYEPPVSSITIAGIDFAVQSTKLVKRGGKWYWLIMLEDTP